MKATDYVKKRKAYLKEMKELVFDRAEINKVIRKITSEMQSLDRWLIK